MGMLVCYLSLSSFNNPIRDQNSGNTCDWSDQWPSVNIQYRIPEVDKLQWSRQKTDLTAAEYGNGDWFVKEKSSCSWPKLFVKISPLQTGKSIYVFSSLDIPLQKASIISLLQLKVCAFLNGSPSPLDLYTLANLTSKFLYQIYVALIPLRNPYLPVTCWHVYKYIKTFL